MLYKAFVGNFNGKWKLSIDGYEIEQSVIYEIWRFGANLSLKPKDAKIFFDGRCLCLLVWSGVVTLVGFQEIGA